MVSSVMRNFISLVAVFMFSASGAVAKDIPSILLFGDSLMAGYGLPADESLSVRMQALLKEKGIEAKVINAGVSGDTSSGGRTRLEWTLKQYSPHIVVLGLGANDMLRGIRPDITKQNLDAMLATLTADKNRKVVLSEVVAPMNMGAQFSSQFNGIFAELADKYNVPLYPFLIKNIYGKPQYMLADGAHPNAAGVSLIASELTDYLVDELDLE